MDFPNGSNFNFDNVSNLNLKSLFKKIKDFFKKKKDGKKVDKIIKDAVNKIKE